MATQDEALRAIKSHLENERQSTSLSLAYFSLSLEGVAEVAKFVRDNPFTKHLDLRGNSIDSQGVSALSNGIKGNRSLRSLNLKWNAIGKNVSGVDALCIALKANMTIKNVDLRNNHINKVGAQHIGEMLKTNTTITHIDLAWNDFGVEGGIALLDGLKRNQSLIQCQLSGSKVGNDCLSEVEFLLRRNRALAARKAEDFAPEKLAPGSYIKPDETGGYNAKMGASATSFRSFRPRTAKDDSRLMLRLIIMEREAVHPEDKLFFQEIEQHIENLLHEATLHLKGKAEGEDRERLSTAGFLSREERYNREIQTTEESIQRVLVEEQDLKRDVAQQQIDLKELEFDNLASIRDVIKSKEHSMAEEQKLQKDLRDAIQEKRDLTNTLALVTKDMELLDQENERLREHVQNFQRHSSEVLS